MKHPEGLNEEWMAKYELMLSSQVALTYSLTSFEKTTIYKNFAIIWSLIATLRPILTKFDI